MVFLFEYDYFGDEDCGSVCAVFFFPPKWIGQYKITSEDAGCITVEQSELALEDQKELEGDESDFES